MTQKYLAQKVLCNIVFHFGKALIELKKLQVKPPERGQISGQVPIILTRRFLIVLYNFIQITYWHFKPIVVTSLIFQQVISIRSSSYPRNWRKFDEDLIVSKSVVINICIRLNLWVLVGSSKIDSYRGSVRLMIWTRTKTSKTFLSDAFVPRYHWKLIK